MRVLIMVTLALFLITPALADGPERCIKKDEEVYCQQTITIGGVKLNVKNPEELLRAANRSTGGLKKTGLYDDYHRIPVIVELAAQNGKEYDEFVTFMIDNWNVDEKNPFMVIRQFEEVYDTIDPQYRPTVVNGIAWQIAHDVAMEVIRVFGGEIRSA